MDDDKMMNMILIGVKSYFDERDNRERAVREQERVKAKAEEEAKRKKIFLLDVVTFCSFIGLLVYGMYKFQIIDMRNILTLW